MTTRHIGLPSRIWQITSTYRGQNRTIKLDLQSNRLRVLSAELGQSWYELVTNIDYAVSTSRRMSVVVGTFLAYAAATPIRSSLSLDNDGNEFVDCFHQWEQNLRSCYASTSNLPYKDSQQLLQIIRWHVQARQKVGDRVSARADSSPLHLPIRESPVDELPNRTRIELRDHCRDVVRAAEKRIGRGIKLALGSTEIGGLELSSDEILRSKSPKSLSPVTDLSPSPESNINPRVQSNQQEQESYVASTREFRGFWQRVSASSYELQAYRILILMETGWAPEQLTDIHLSDLEWTDQKVRVRTQKLRAKTYKDHEYYRGTSRWNVYALLERLLSLTKHIRHLCPLPLKDQFLFVRISQSIVAAPPRALTESFRNVLLKDLVLGSGISWSGAYDIRRIRKTFKSVQGAVAGTSSGAAGMDHTVQVSRDHYMQTTTVHVIAAKVTNIAQKMVYDSLISAPTVVPIEAATAEQLSSRSKMEKTLAAQTLAASPKDMEMAVAACKDPYDSPFSVTGKLCHVRPSMCFLCPNALIFVDHLPRILAFRRTLEERRPDYSPLEFQAIWGQTMNSIETILANFSATQLEQSATTATENIHIPLAQKVRF